MSSSSRNALASTLPPSDFRDECCDSRVRFDVLPSEGQRVKHGILTLLEVFRSRSYLGSKRASFEETLHSSIFRFSFSLLCNKSRQLAAVDLLRGVLRPDALEVDHSGLDVTMAQPRLHGADVHAVP